MKKTTLLLLVLLLAITSCRNPGENNKLDGNVESSKVQEAIKEKVSGSQAFLVRQEKEGFSLILVKKESDQYLTEVYSPIFLGPNGLVRVEDPTQDPPSPVKEAGEDLSPSAIASDIQKKYLPDLIQKYEEEGYETVYLTPNE
ncbi:hypothetical protein [Kallipyga massiliensis]|uniref:hypothetical protein n=1 Tax=Kallipyga massiliensis TaxID=1472764 RepID=UPI0026E9D867|nr:hypothetical protein [Kallipyga massiliensis]